MFCNSQKQTELINNANELKENSTPFLYIPFLLFCHSLLCFHFLLDSIHPSIHPWQLKYKGCEAKNIFYFIYHWLPNFKQKCMFYRMCTINIWSLCLQTVLSNQIVYFQKEIGICVMIRHLLKTIQNDSCNTCTSKCIIFPGSSSQFLLIKVQSE